MNVRKCAKCGEGLVYGVDGDWWSLPDGSIGCDEGGSHEPIDTTPPSESPSACECCNGTGEHLDGHECYVCDASGQASESKGEVCEGHHGRPDNGPGNAKERYGDDFVHASVTAGYEGVTHAGLAVVSVDGLSVLLEQRAYDETDEPDVVETWEFPSGGLECVKCLAAASSAVSGTSTDETTATAVSLDLDSLRCVSVTRTALGLSSVHSGGTNAQKHIVAASLGSEVAQSDAGSVNTHTEAGRGVTSVMDRVPLWHQTTRLEIEPSVEVLDPSIEMGTSVACGSRSTGENQTPVPLDYAAGNSVGKQGEGFGVVHEVSVPPGLTHDGAHVLEEPFAGASREFSEEIGFDLPEGQVTDGWRSPNGVYQGFVYRLTDELDLRGWTGTDEVADADWFTREMIEEHENLRPEVRDQTDWDLIFGVSGNEEQVMDEASEYASIPVGPIPVHGIVAPEEVPTGDQRGFAAKSMTKRPLRLPLRDTATDVGAHNGAFVAGSVDRMMRSGGANHFEGLLMPGAAEALIEKMQFFGGRFGVSVDGDQGTLDEKRTENEGVLWFDKVRASGLTAVDIPAFHEAYVAFGTHPTMPTDDALVASAYEAGDLIGARSEAFDRGPGWVTDPKATKNIHDYWTKKGEEGYAKIGWGTTGDWTRAKALIGAKIAQHSPEKMKYLNQIISQWHFDALGYWPGDLGKPGNAPDTAENRRRAATHAALDPAAKAAFADRMDDMDRDDLMGLDETDEGESIWEAVLTSSAVSGNRKRPSLSYFHQHPSMVEDPWAAESGALIVEEPDEYGFIRTWGYAAQWGVCHVGMDGRCVEPPRSGSDDYPAFHLGRTKTEEGYVYTGVLTCGVGHRDADTILSESPEQAMFDNIKNAWAAVRVGENERGIWFSGVVLPKVDDDLLVKIEASGQVSGEWMAGAMRACLTVNVPGFPNERPTAAYDDEGNVLALAASAFTTVANAPCSTEEDPVGDLALAVMDRIEAKARMDVHRQKYAEERFAALKNTWEG